MIKPRNTVGQAATEIREHFALTPGLFTGLVTHITLVNIIRDRVETPLLVKIAKLEKKNRELQKIIKLIKEGHSAVGRTYDKNL